MWNTAAALAGNSSLNQVIQDAYWLWPVLEIVHFVGLSLLFGGLLIVDLRMLGFFRCIDQTKTRRLLPAVMVGFALNAVTGVLFFFGDPGRYAANIGFRIKMGLILIAGVNAVLYHWKVVPLARPVSAAVVSPWPKLSATISLMTWAGVLWFGRLIPYIGSG